jgi:Calx-beta domain/Putative Ig domain
VFTFHRTSRPAGRRVAVLAAGAGALALVTGALAPSVASATDGTAPYIGGQPDPQRAGSPVSFDYYTHGSPTCSVTDGALPAGVTLDPAACGLRGTPFVGGLSTFTVTATNGVAPDASVQTTLEVDALAAGGDQELDPVLDQPFDQHVFSLDYPAPTFSLDDPSDLPDGLTLDPDGRLHGTPTSLQRADTLSLRATNNLGTSVRDLVIRVQAPTAAITGTPGQAAAGIPYDFRFGWTGAGAPSFSLTSGQLPRGLSLTTDGALAGTPQEVTPASDITVSATDGVATASTTVSLTVGPSAAAIWGTPPMGTRWIGYSWHYGLGGIPAPTTSVISGQLPPGLTLSDDGWISGVPSEPGHYEFTVIAINGSGAETMLPSSIDVSGGSIALNGLPPQGTVGSAYSYQFDVGGFPAPAVTVTGDVPRGLTVSPTGLLAGTPTTPGTYRFTLQADNGVDPSPTWTSTVQILAAHTGTPTPAVRIEGHRAAEGDRGTTPFTITVSLSRASATRVTVHWATANGTAKAGSDYAARSGTLTFAPGQTTRTVTVQVTGDRAREATEAFTVRLSRPTHATLGQAVAAGTIVDDD